LGGVVTGISKEKRTSRGSEAVGRGGVVSPELPNLQIQNNY